MIFALKVMKAGGKIITISTFFTEERPLEQRPYRFRTSLTSLVNKFAEEWGYIKRKEDRLTGDDIREGLTAIISVKISEPQFEGQTKTKLGNTEAKSFTQKTLNDAVGAWFEKNPSEGKEIVRKAIDAATARIAAAKDAAVPRDHRPSPPAHQTTPAF